MSIPQRQGHRSYQLNIKGEKKMKALFLALTLLVSGNAFAANGSGNVSNVIGIGAIGSSPTAIAPQSSIPEGNISGALSGFDQDKYFQLSASNQLTFSAGNIAVWYRNGVQYVVTAAHKAVCTQYTSAAQVPQFTQLVDSDTVFSNNTAPGSMPGVTLYQGGANAQYTMFNLVANTFYSQSLTYVFDAGHYPGLQINIGSGTGAMVASLWCKEI
jgi:hypothetical protein